MNHKERRAAAKAASTKTIIVSDLEPFCLTEDQVGEREKLRRPWPSGEYTYATNGWVIVKIPRLADVEARDGPPTDDQIERLWSGVATQKLLRPLPARLKLPADEEPETEGCWRRHGSSHLHSCPDCKCECTLCNGTGTVPEPSEPVQIFGACFNSRMIKTLTRLPDMRFSDQCA
jgi:hypothetical protein